MDPVEQVQLYSRTSDLTIPKKYQMSLQRRAMPPGKKYHVFFSYSSSDIQWVKETVEKLERDHGLVCCEYDRDNTPGTSLLTFANNSIRHAYKTVVVMTKEAFQSDFVLHEIEMAITHGFNERRKAIVPVLLKDCEVPGHLRILNYVDVRDHKRRDIWWPKLIIELDIQDVMATTELVQIPSGTSDLTTLEEYQMSLQRRALPPGKKYHAFFCYCSSDIQWVKETIERLEKDHGFICCEYDRDNTPGTPLLQFSDNSIKYAYKTVVVMTKEAFQSGFVLHEIDMAISQGFVERRKVVVPILLKDCEVPRQLTILNYVDVRDRKRRDIWWPKLLMELDIQEHVIPEEILKLDPRSLQMYKEALQNEKVKVYNIRVMVVGQYGVGKTTLTKRLLGQDVNISERESTNGIDVCIQFNRISPETGQWTPQPQDTGKYSGLQRLVTLFMQHTQNSKSSNKQGIDTVKKERPGAIEENVPIDSTGLHQENKSSVLESGIQRNITFTSAQHIISSKDVVMEILQLVNDNPDKFEKTMAEVAAIGMWDFAGQCVYYTTHQAFLTRRAVYLLVTDLSQQVTDVVLDDQHFFDSDGIKPHTVYDLVEVWMNSIHSCALTSEAGTPPVILVATHADKVPKDCRENVSAKHFSQIRDKLEDKPSVCHLADEDFVIDNTVCDPQLEALKTKIIELAKKQLYWGEEVPAKWLALEQTLMTFRAAGIKVLPFSLLENLNEAGSVRIETREELVLFVKFQHEMGMVLYFSAEGLGDKIVLEPQWIINALNSLITSREFIRKKNPACIPMWSEFEKKGKLKPQLIDAIWTKEKNEEFHDNKDYIILLMEKLNIIAKPRSYSEDGKTIKKEDYFLAPCMLKEITPKDVMSPQPNSHMGSSSVLCYVFTGNFLPPPVFHRLIATCLAQWSIAKKKTENQIFCGCCVFDIDNCHRLILYHRDYVVFARVTRWGITDKIPALQMCIEVKEFIAQELSRIIGYLSQSLQYELHILCPESNGNSPDIFIPLSELQKNSEVVCHSHDESHVIVSKDLVKFWFEDLKQSKKDDTQSRSREEQNESVRPLGEIIYVREETEGQGLSDADLLGSSHEGAVSIDGASTAGLQESVDGSNTENQEQSQDLQESGIHRTTEADDNYNAFSTTKRAEVLLPNNPRGGRIMVLTVKEMESNIGEKIGEGGFGTIYKAKRNDFEFAIKKIKFESELKRKAYEKEIHSGRILHPFINPIIAYAEKPPDKLKKGLLYLMYPYMQNKDLRHNINLVMQGNKLSDEDSNSRIWTRCIYQIVHAVDYLHTPVMSDRPRGAIFHRDLTSQNILLDQNFNAKIGDFGISLEAKVNAKQATVTRAIGTQGYHPPNMIGSQYFPSYDVFSIGVVMLEILTGEKAVLEEVCEFLHAKYRLQEHKLIDCLDQLTEEIENNAAKWTNEGHRNKLAELALKAVSLDESERKITNLLQELDDMRLDSVHHYKKPASQERCVSCYVNPAAKLSPKGTKCVKSGNPCQYFCRHCLMNYHINPLICPQHGKTRPPFGDHVYGVFVAGNNVENMQELSDGEDPSKVAQTFVRDAEKVVQILTTKHPFVLGANAGHLKIVKPNKPGTKEEMTRCIQNAFTEISRMIDEECKQTEYKPNNRLPDSLFIFYFTGHCSKEKGLYLGNAEETLKASTEWINEMLHQKLHVDQVLVILDCCHADSQNFVHTQGFHTNTEENSPNLVHEGNKVNILQLSSCDTHQKSSALCAGQNHGQGSHFTDFLCKGLLGLDSENMGKNDIIYCDACKRKQGKNKEMDIGLPCVMYHLRCDRDHAVTITALKDYIQGHMDLPASDTDGNKHMTLISSAHGEKLLFLTYYNQDKMHISIHLKGSRKPEMFCFRSLPESIAKLKIEIIKHIVDEKVDCEMLLFYQSYIKVASVKQNMDCAILFSDPSYIQTFSCQIAIYPKYGREKDVEMEDMVHLYEAWHSNFELEARIREHVNGLCNGPVKLNTINKSMIPEHEDLFSSDYLRITQNDVEISIEQKSEAESQIKEIITKSSSTQLREFRKFLREVLNIIQDIPTQILEKKQKEVLKFNLYDDFSVLVIDDMSFRNPV